MNEILKFKRGRQIPKALGGQRFVEAGRTTWGDKIWADTTTGDLYKGNQDPNDPNNRYNPDYLKPGSRGHLGKSTTVRGFKTGLAHPVTINGADYIRKSTAPRDYSFMKGGTRQRTAEELAKWEVEVLRLAAIQKLYGAKPESSRITRSTNRPKFQNRLGELNLNDDEKTVLAQHGVTDFNNAMQIQNAMLALSPNANLGAKKGAGVADGYFGNLSLEAFQALRRSGAFVPKVDATEPVKPVNQTPVDAPDFGYKSEGNYSADQAGILKANGIRDWSSLINYAGRNKDSDFTKLLSGYFGTNDITLWDRNKLESDAKIHGNYHGQDRSQLQGFLGGLQARNNQQYYDKVAAYAKQNPTPTTPRFDFSKISKLEVPEFKFNLSSAGASTLGGNIGLI